MSGLPTIEEIRSNWPSHFDQLEEQRKPIFSDEELAGALPVEAAEGQTQRQLGREAGQELIKLEAESRGDVTDDELREAVARYDTYSIPGFKNFSEERQLGEYNARLKRAGLPPTAFLPEPKTFGEEAKDLASFRGLLRATPIASAGLQLYDHTTQLLAAKGIEEAERRGAPPDQDDLKVMRRAFVDQVGEMTGKTFGAQVLGGLVDTIALGGEIALAGGGSIFAKVLQKGAQKGAKKVASNAILDNLYGAAKTLGIGVFEGAKLPVATVKGIRTFTPRMAASTVERMIPDFHFEPDDRGDIQFVMDSPGEDFIRAMPSAVLDTMIETGSEFGGEGFNKAWALIPGTSYMKKAKVAVMGVLARKFKAQGVAKPWAAATKILRSVGWNGVVGEVGEEELGRLLRAAMPVVDLGEWAEAIPVQLGGKLKLEQLAVEATVAMIMPGLALGATSAARQVGRLGNVANRTPEDVAKGMTPAQRDVLVQSAKDRQTPEEAEAGTVGVPTRPTFKQVAGFSEGGEFRQQVADYASRINERVEQGLEEEEAISSVIPTITPTKVEAPEPGGEVTEEGVEPEVAVDVETEQERQGLLSDLPPEAEAFELSKEQREGLTTGMQQQLERTERAKEEEIEGFKSKLLKEGRLVVPDDLGVLPDAEVRDLAKRLGVKGAKAKTADALRREIEALRPAINEVQEQQELGPDATPAQRMPDSQEHVTPTPAIEEDRTPDRVVPFEAKETAQAPGQKATEGEFSVNPGEEAFMKRVQERVEGPEQRAAFDLLKLAIKQEQAKDPDAINLVEMAKAGNPTAQQALKMGTVGGKVLTDTLQAKHGRDNFVTRQSRPRDAAGAAITKDVVSPVRDPTDPPDPTISDDVPNVWHTEFPVALETPGKRPTHAEAVGFNQIQDQLVKVLRAAGSNLSKIFVGRLPKSSLGKAWAHNYEVRVRRAGDIPVLAHEVAHGVEHVIYGRPKGSPWGNKDFEKDVTSAMEAELVGLGVDRYKENVPNGGYKREGFAEYMRLWLSDPAKISEKAPKFHEWFTKDWMPRYQDITNELVKARSLVRKFQTQGSIGVALGQIERDTIIDRGKLLIRQVKAHWFRQLVDLLHPLGMIDPVLARKNNIVWYIDDKDLKAKAKVVKNAQFLPADTSPYALADMQRNQADSVVWFMINHGMIDGQRNHRGKPLVDTINLIRGKGMYDGFLAYLYAKRTVALQEPRKGGKTKKVKVKTPEGELETFDMPVDKPIETGLPPEHARQIIKELDAESPNYALAAQKFYDWNNGVLDYVASLSPHMRRIVNLIRKVDPGDYAPLNRVFDEIDNVWGKEMSTGSSAAMKGQLVAKLRGNARRIKSPFEQAIVNALSFVKLAHTRSVMERLIGITGLKGSAEYITKVPKNKVIEMQRPLSQILEHVKQQVDVDIPEILTDLAEQASEQGEEVEGIPADKQELDKMLRELITFYTPETSGKTYENIIPYTDTVVHKDGTEEVVTEFYQVRPDIFETMMRLDLNYNPFTNAILAKVWELGVATPARAFRAGTTSLRASFSWIANPFRDFLTMSVNSRTGPNPFPLWHQWLKSWGDASMGFIGKKDNPWYDAYLRLGIPMSTFVGQDIRFVKRSLRQHFQGRRVRVLDPRNWLEGFRELMQVPENVPRLAEMKLAAKEVGWSPGKPMSMAQAMHMQRAARQVTTDFSSAGELSRVMNQMIPFWNAAIQGPRANIRAAKRDPFRFVTMATTMIALPTLLLWWRNKDEEWYTELDSRNKFLNWWFPMGENTLIKLPRPFDVGMIAGSTWEAIADAIYREDPEIMTEFMKTLLATTYPGFTPLSSVIGKEIYNQASNRDHFWDRPIVSRRLMGLAKREQFDVYTTKAAITIGQVFNVSPVKVDHAIRGILGGAPADALDWIGLGAKGIEKEREAADIPVAGRLFRRGGKLGSRPKSVGEFYDHLEHANQRSNSIINPETEQEEKMRLMLITAGTSMGSLFYLRKFQPDNAKRAILMRQALDLAQDANRRYAMGNSERGDFDSMRRELRVDKEIAQFQLGHKAARPEEVQQDKEKWVKKLHRTKPEKPSRKGKRASEYRQDVERWAENVIRWEEDIDLAWRWLDGAGVSSAEARKIYRQQIREYKNSDTKKAHARQFMRSRRRKKSAAN